ncbi:MAG: DUF3667 domain-containing protein [Luteimonas sp.]|nr:DUF3667 domain-containing protein [Luteimonas sp.]
MTDPRGPTDIAPAIIDARSAVRVDAVDFEAARCRNCGAALDAPYCGQCGQAHARRIGIRDLRDEAWIRWRWFDKLSAQTAMRLLTSPGRVAREYVLGGRSRHFHPLKLLLVAVGLLLLALARANYLQSHAEEDTTRAMALAAAYGKWSFSLGIASIFAASLAVFPRRLGYNPVEHLVLAAYCHAVILLLLMLNMLPLMFDPQPGFIAAHKLASSYYMFAVKAVVVGLAFTQFFVLDLRRDWWRLLLALVVFITVNWALVQAYAQALSWYVTNHA